MFNCASFRKSKRENPANSTSPLTLATATIKSVKNASFAKYFSKTTNSLNCDGRKREKDFDMEKESQNQNPIFFENKPKFLKSESENRNKENFQLKRKDESSSLIPTLSNKDNGFESGNSVNSRRDVTPPAKRRPPPISITNPSSLNNINEPTSKRKMNVKLVLTQDISEAEKDQLEKFLISRENIGQLTDDELFVEDELGFGNGGVVYKVKHSKTGTIMAKKLIRLEVNPTIRNQILRELNVLNNCNSPNIVGFYGSYHQDGEINICMEYMDIGSLDSVLRKVNRIPELILAKITEAVLKGLIYLKETHQIMHRDIKPSNILINSKGEIKLCDFGVSGKLIDSMAGSFVGTRCYMSPERLEGEQYTIQSDIWSLGLSLIEMALGRYPIPTPSEQEIDAMFQQHMHPSKSNKEAHNLSIFALLECIVNHPPPVLPKKYFSEEFMNFVNECLKRKPSDRPGLKNLLSHPFIQSNKLEQNDFREWILKINNKNHK